MPTLFHPLTIGAVEVKNRVLMAPLTRNRALPDGTPADMAVEYYRQRAGAGLIITEATQVSAFGKGYLNTPGIHCPEHVLGWKKITDAVQQAGGKIFLQLWHVGRISHTSLLPDGKQPLAPSAIRAKAQTYTENGMTDVSEPRAITLEEIPDIVNQYRIAANYAKEAGFDGVEVHAANGYLIDQFLSDKTNKRDDAYGGSADNRTRFLMDIIEAVTEVFAPERVGVRLSPTGTFNDMGDSNPIDTYGTAIDKLNAYNLAYLHMVETFPGIDTNKEDRTILDTLIKRWDGIYLANGDFTKEKANDYLAEGKADAITFGRTFIANPDLPERLRLDAELNEPDQETFYGGDEHGYTDYPTLKQKKAA